MSKIRFVGFDVHADTIAIAVAETTGEVHSVGTIRNRPEDLRKAVHKLGPAEQLRVCYEAGPNGYAVYWQLAELGVSTGEPSELLCGTDSAPNPRSWSEAAPDGSRLCGFDPRISE